MAIVKVDTETGEYLGDVTTYYSKKFWKCFRNDFMKVLELFENKQIKVFAYICKNISPYSNILQRTYKEIAKDCGVSEPTIAEVMKALQISDDKNGTRVKKYGFIRKVRNGLWMINPDIFMQGDESKRKHLSAIYNSDNLDEAILHPPSKHKG